MELIDKDALVAEIERRLRELSQLEKASYEIGLYDAYKIVLSFLNTLEVKDVGLDFQRFAKEMGIVFALPSSETKNTEEEPLNWEYAIAKHFYELGLKTQK